MEAILKVLGSIDDFMGSVLLIMLFGAGILFTARLGFIQFRKFGASFKQMFGNAFSKKSEKGSLSSFQALATAVAAQIGTGNVAGVAGAILAGGPGAVFWMWVLALLGMSTIFAEAVLAQLYRERQDGELVGGPSYYISKGLGHGALGKFLAGFFAVSIILALGLIGNMVQSNSIAGVMSVAFSIPTWIIGIVLAILAALIFIGGVSRIGRFAQLVVPFMAVIYIIASITIMIIFRAELLPTLKMIIKAAFTPEAAIGGIVGTTIKQAVLMGAKRGLFSNEAGMGSTPHAHAVAKVNHPAEQGLAAMCGVFIDTILVCTATALVILVTKAHMLTDAAGNYYEAALLTQQAFEKAFPGFGATFLAIALAFFAFTTIIGWYYFGESNIKYLFGRKGLLPYRLIVCACIIIGAVQKIAVVWKLSDVANEFMVVPNVIALVFLSGQVKKVLKDYDEKKLSGKITYNYPVD